jgi:hypothetical protein
MRETEIRATYIINLRCADIQRQVASRNEREENDISRWGFETFLGKRGVHNLLHYETEKLHSVFLSGNREIKRGGGGEVYKPPLRGRGEQFTFTVVTSGNTEVEIRAHKEQMVTYQLGNRVQDANDGQKCH